MMRLLFASVLALLLAACMPIQPEGATVPMPTSAPAAGATATVTGTVTKLDRRALTPGTTVTVRLSDVSRADAAAIVLAEQVIVLQGEQVPIPYVLEYDPAQIDERNTYAVSARIEENGALRYINDTAIHVITRGAPTEDVEIRVVPVQ